MIFANLIKRLPAPNPKATKTLVLAHREELLNQARNQILRFSPELKVALEKGNDWATPEAEVIVASVPTLGRTGSGEERLSRFDPSEFKCIIVDEAHHSVAESYLRIMRHFGIQGGESDILLWGCSATLSRNDELALGDLFEEVVYHLDLREMIERRWLCPVEMYQLSTDINLSQVAWKAGDFDPTSLQLAIDTPLRNSLIVGCWQQQAMDVHQRKATIVFALNIAHCRSLQHAFHQAGVPAQIITSETVPAERQKILQQYQAGEIPVLINCAVLTEGTDLPRTDCILMTRPTCNANLYMQMVGRGLRLHPGKEHCLVLDVVDRLRANLSRSLVSMPSLLAGRRATEKGDSPAEAKEKQKAETSELDPDKVDVQMERVSNADLEIDRRLAWIKIEQDHWILAGKDHLFRLTPKWHICQVEGKKVTNIFHATTVQQLCQQFYQSLTEDQMEAMSTKVYWRNKSPPSAAQLKLLASIGAKTGMSGVDFRLLYRWTIGRAANVISKYIYLTKHLRRDPSWQQLVE